jgi:hypothetical protein
VSLRINTRKKNEKSFNLFKKIGPEKKINLAYANRKFLDVFGPANIFSVLCIIGSDVYVGPIIFDKITLYEFLLLNLTFLQQLFISIRSNEECVIQRKLAIALSLMKFPLILYILNLCLKDISHSVQMIFFNVVFNYINLIILNLTMTVVLIFDYKKFGSGLKEHLKNNSSKFNLSE